MSEEPSWTTPQSLPVANGDCHDPAIAISGGVVHFVWARDRLLHHARLTGGAWQPAVRFAAGEDPVLSVDGDGLLHCVFANWFLGNCELHHTVFDGESWGYAEWVSRTLGVSRQPALACGADGDLRVAWSDDTPGEPVIYYGGRGRIAWLHAPIPNAHGTQPAVATSETGEVYVAWQHQVLQAQGDDVIHGPYQVLASVLSAEAWSLPELVSEDHATDAMAPSLVAAPGGAVHIFWQEDRGGQFVIQHAVRLEQGWSVPQTISELGIDSRLPRGHADEDGLQVLWAEGGTIRRRRRGLAPDAAWGDVETVVEAGDLSEYVVAASPGGDLVVAWSAYESGDRQSIRYTKLGVPQGQQTLLPLIPGFKR